MSARHLIASYEQLMGSTVGSMHSDPSSPSSAGNQTPDSSSLIGVPSQDVELAYGRQSAYGREEPPMVHLHHRRVSSTKEAVDFTAPSCASLSHMNGLRITFDVSSTVELALRPCAAASKLDCLDCPRAPPSPPPHAAGLFPPPHTHTHLSLTSPPPPPPAPQQICYSVDTKQERLHIIRGITGQFDSGAMCAIVSLLADSLLTGSSH
jgi:hypothetical protein